MMKKPKFTYFLLFILFFATNASSAQSGYESLPESKIPEYQNPKYFYQLLGKAHQTILDINLQQNTLSDIKEKFSAPDETPIEGFHHASSICLSSSKENDDTHILFIKNPMADLLGFILMSGDSKIKEPNNCYSSSAIHKGVKTASGIMIGDTKEKILKILAPPSSKTNTMFKYTFELLTKFPKEQFEWFVKENPNNANAAYDTVESHLDIEFLNNKLVSYTVTTVKYY